MADPVTSCNGLSAPHCDQLEVQPASVAPAVAVAFVRGPKDAYAAKSDVPKAASDPKASVPFAVRMHQPTPVQTTAAIDKSDARFSALAELAREYYTGLKSYPSMTAAGYTLIYGPLADVAPENEVARARSTMWQLDRIHSWDPDVVALFGSLSIAAAERDGRHAAFTLKHAPGYGHLEGGLETTKKLPKETRSLKDVERDFKPFRVLLDRFGPETAAVMIGGAILEAVDPNHPSVFSPKTVRWVRDNLGPQGEKTVLVTDDINTSIFTEYLDGQMGKEKKTNARSRLEKIKFMIKRLVEADVDIMLDYGSISSYGGLKLFANAGKELLDEGAISRKALERSVKRILHMKARIYPDHPLLKDIDATVAAMTDEQLFWQKLVVPCAWGSEKDQSRFAANFGVGLTMEGLEEYLPRVQEYTHEAVKTALTPPPFVANNSPQELAGLDNRGNSKFRFESKPIHKFTELVEKLFPDGIPAGFMDAIYEDITKPKDMLALAEQDSGA
ncbi:MAG: hypothetical protein HQM16_09085 [Deltaproteobacteria bacterium]|nr:hypothetical protein [Deltaproteobacteria bacterium]